jgi:hypothetical protein
LKRWLADRRNLEDLAGLTVRAAAALAGAITFPD